MNDNDNFTPTLMVLLVTAFVVPIFFAQGYSVGEKSARKETISYCVEKPADCKIKYDFYKLENPHK